MATLRLPRCAPTALVHLAISAAASAEDSEGDVEAFVEEIVAASVAVLIALAAVVSAVAIDSAAPPTLQAVLALHPAATAVDLTVTATTTEAAVDLDAMTDLVVGTAAVAASTDLPAATTNPSALATATAVTVVAAVGIAIEARTTAEGATTTAGEMTAVEETTHASARTKAARAMRESGSCVDTNYDMTFGSCGGYPESTCLAFPVLISFTFDNPRVSRRKRRLSCSTLDYCQAKYAASRGLRPVCLSMQPWIESASDLLGPPIPPGRIKVGRIPRKPGVTTIRPPSAFNILRLSNLG